MLAQSLPASESVLPFFAALILSGGSLLIYVAGAVVSRLTLGQEGKTTRSFNLGIPFGNKPEDLFAISIVSAATTFSTVFVLFLTNAGTMGLHLLFCPLSFGVGLLFMLFVYKRADERGYLDDSSSSGLIPYFGYRLTNSKLVEYLLVLVSLFPLLAILALELRYGIPVLNSLLQHAFPTFSPSPDKSFVVFMLLLLSYVFVGGFRAVITSDVWQYRTMKTSLAIVLISMVILALQSRGNLDWGVFHQAIGGKRLLSFYVSIAIMNLFAPLCMATTWQRFRAFRVRSIDMNAAVKSAATKAVFLWGTLIAIGILLHMITGQAPSQVSAGLDTSPLNSVLETIRKQGDWFAFIVFPLVTVAAFSGMYSSCDTCVSALLYLTESGGTDRGARRADSPLSGKYYWAMGGLFVVTMTMYLLMTYVKPATNLMELAQAVFGNAVVLAPTVLLLTRLGFPSSKSQARSRSVYLLFSLALGFGAYWSFWSIQMHGAYPLRGWEIIAGLTASSVPAYVLLRRERWGKKKEDGSVVSIKPELGEAV